MYRCSKHLIISIIILVFSLNHTMVLEDDLEKTDLAYGFLYLSNGLNFDSRELKDYRELFDSRDIPLILDLRGEVSLWQEDFYLLKAEKLKYIPFPFLVERAKKEGKPLLFYFEEVPLEQELLEYFEIMGNDSLKKLSADYVEKTFIQENIEEEVERSFIDLFARIFLYILGAILISLIGIFFYSRKQVDRALFDD